MCMAWCEVECRRDVEWCAEMWWSDLMWIMVRCEMWCQCGMLQFQTWWIEMQKVRCGIWHGVEYSVLVCGMLHNARCVKLRSEMRCEIAVKNVAYALCSAIVWRQMWKMMKRVAMSQSDVVVWCKIKMWWCNAMWNMVWCKICCNA